MEVASSCRGLGGTAVDGVAERLGLIPTKGAERGVMSIKPGGPGVGSHVAFLRAHLVCNQYGYWLVSSIVLILSLFYD